jgi:hypothetical protein
MCNRVRSEEGMKIASLSRFKCEQFHDVVLRTVKYIWTDI